MTQSPGAASLLFNHEMETLLVSWLDRYAAESGMAASSAKVYRSMCAKFGRHLDAFAISDVQNFKALEKEMSHFLEEGEHSVAMCKRYVALMGTLWERNIGMSPFSTLARTHNKAPRALPQALPEHGEQDVLLAAERALSSGAGDWRLMRDAGIVACIIGAGLRPAEIVSLTEYSLDTRQDPHAFDVPGRAARFAPISRAALPAIQKWMDYRMRMDIPGEILFPSTLNGTPFSPSGLWRRVSAFLEEIGLQGSGVKLRNTFAVRQLANGKSSSSVSQWLGHREHTSITPLLQVSKRRSRTSPG